MLQAAEDTGQEALIPLPSSIPLSLGSKLSLRVYKAIPGHLRQPRELAPSPPTNLREVPMERTLLTVWSVSTRPRYSYTQLPRGCLESDVSKTWRNGSVSKV